MKKTLYLVIFGLFIFSGVTFWQEVNAQISCTGSATQRTGICKASCGTSETTDTDTVCGTSVCCVPTASEGAACVGTAMSKAGTCRTTCNTGESADVASSCGIYICCVSQATQGTTCNSGKGTCKASCLSSETSSTDATCTSPTPSCCTATSSGGGGTGSGSGSSTIQFSNPLAYNTVEEVLGAILTGLQGIIVTLALVFLVVGAVMYVTSAGNDKQIETAKGAIFAAMIGLALGIAAPSFLKEISSILGWSSTPSSVSGAVSIATILLNVLNFLLNILGILAIIMMVIGGFMYLTSAGDEDRIDRGKKILIWSIVGVIVALASLIIVRQIADFF